MEKELNEKQQKKYKGLVEKVNYLKSKYNFSFNDRLLLDLSIISLVLSLLETEETEEFMKAEDLETINTKDIKISDRGEGWSKAQQEYEERVKKKIGLTPIEALEYLDDIAHGRKMNYDAHELYTIVKSELEEFEYVKKRYSFILGVKQ